MQTIIYSALILYQGQRYNEIKEKIRWLIDYHLTVYYPIINLAQQAKLTIIFQISVKIIVIKYDNIRPKNKRAWIELEYSILKGVEAVS